LARDGEFRGKVSGFYFENEWFKCQSEGVNFSFRLSVKQLDVGLYAVPFPSNLISRV